jgi:ABC-2 type transport system permease protein
MNGKAFFAMLARDAHVARRNVGVLLMQTFFQPLMFVFIFGRVMVRSGYMPEAYKSLLLPGIMAISMVFTGVWAVAMPLIAEFQFTREIEDRLLAPIEIAWVAVEKVLAGTLQALLAGLIVIPCAWLILRPGVGISMHNPLAFACVTLLVALFSACGGLALGCSVNQQHIGVMFSMVLTPMIFFGCTYYQRGIAGDTGAAVPSSSHAGSAGGIDGLRRRVSGGWTPSVPGEGRKLREPFSVLGR